MDIGLLFTTDNLTVVSKFMKTSWNMEEKSCKEQLTENTGSQI